MSATTSWRVLLSIDVLHAYYTDLAGPMQRFTPTPESQCHLHRAGVLVRSTGTGLVVLADAEATRTLQADDGAAWSWQVQAGEASFAACTADLAQHGEQVLVFDASGAVPDAAHVDTLHLQPVSPVAPEAPADPRSSLQRRLADPRGTAPWALVHLPCHALRAAAARPTAQRFVIRLSAPATVWKYCLVGDWCEPHLEVVDVSGTTAFAPDAPCLAADGRTARVFRSDRPIALRQQPPQRFQLRSRSAGSLDDTRPRDKVLVKRLPAPGPRHVSREVIGGASALVSEIFVHR